MVPVRALSRLAAGVKWQHAFMFLVLLSFALAGASILWSAHDVTANDRKWCALVSTIDQANAAAHPQPPKGSFGARFVTEIHALRGELGCG